MKNAIKTSILAFLLAGCATIAPPRDLLDARAADKRESAGVTAKFNPADLHSAKESLAVAEQSFADNGDTQETRDLSYIADIGFQTAASRARTLQAAQETGFTAAQMNANIAAAGERSAAGLDRANQELALQDQAMQNEKARRVDAEKRAAQAAADLARLGSVKQEPRGMVLTLSGSVLFATNKTELLPSAQVKLNQVADVLVKQDPNSKIVVEGFTDSQGTAGYNQDLSQRRATAVRNYLVTRGIASDRVTSQGYGLNRPVADNSSAEGRANNRRVEIVVQPSTQL